VSDYFIGQVMMTGFNFAQKYFLQCNGSLLAIQQNQALFSLLGTIYGGNGVTNFALPDLRSRTPVGGVTSADPSWSPPTLPPGTAAGTESVTLLAMNLPPHTHLMAATTAAGSDAANNGSEVFAALGGTATLYGPANALLPLTASPTSQTGGNAPHSNMQPYEVINFNICQYGVFPSRN